MEAFIFLAVIMMCISIPWFISANREASYAADDLYTAKNRLSTLCWEYNSLQRKLGETLAKDPENTGCQVREVTNILKDCKAKMEEIKSQQSTCRQKQYAAYDALESHRRYQNFMGGGANDLSALFYYKNESKYVKANMKTPDFNPDIFLIQRANEYVRSHWDWIKEDDVKLLGNETQNLSKSGNTKEAAVNALPEEKKGAETEQTAVIKTAVGKAETAGHDKKAKVKKKHRLLKFSVALTSAATLYVLVSVIGGKNWDEIKKPVVVAANKMNELLSAQIGTDIVKKTSSKSAASGKQGIESSENTQVVESAQTADNTQTAENSQAAEDTQAVDNAEQTYTTTANLNLREEPSSAGGDSTIICTIPAGAECISLEEFSEDGKWLRVTYNGEQEETGWVNISYIMKNENHATEEAPGQETGEAEGTPGQETFAGSFYQNYEDAQRFIADQNKKILEQKKRNAEMIAALEAEWQRFPDWN